MALDRTKYAGTERTGINRAHIVQDMLDRAAAGEHTDMWTAHNTDVPPRDAFLARWGDSWGDAIDYIYIFPRLYIRYFKSFAVSL